MGTLCLLSCKPIDHPRKHTTSLYELLATNGGGEKKANTQKHDDKVLEASFDDSFDDRVTPSNL